MAGEASWSLHHDEKMMGLAIEEAKKAFLSDEVPIGAVVTDAENRVIGRGYNLRETNDDPTAHAEIVAIKEAAASLRSWRLTGCTLYVTIEPCPMCAGAIILARVDRVVYGASDPKAGAVRTLYRLLDDSRLNHQVRVDHGILHDECQQLIKAFFRSLRKKSGAD